MRTVPVIAMQPFWQIRSSFPRMAIGTSVGPFAQSGLDEALGFAIGSRRVELGEDMTHAPSATGCPKWQRAKHLGVVGHDATYPHAEGAVVLRGMVEERGRAPFTLIGEHLGKGHPRTIVNR